MDDFIKLTSHDNEAIYIRKEWVVSIVGLKGYTEINLLMGKLSILVKEKPEDVMKMIGD
jgi:hypothetical protein